MNGAATDVLDLMRRRPPPPFGKGVGALLLIVVTAGALGHVAVRLKGIDVAYAIGKEQRARAELEEQRRRLQIEIGMLKDPVRVVTIARQTLGMGPPSPGAIRALAPPSPTPLPPTSASAVGGQP